MNSIRPIESSGVKTEYADAPEEADDEPVLSVADAAKALQLSPATVRRYLADHEAFVETRRRGRGTTILLRSFPALARIRDMRQRKMAKDDIDRCLSEPPAEEAAAPATTRANAELDGALRDLQKEFAGLKQELRDNELVVRQSLSTILFLIEKYRKEIEFHASEERLANRERDMLLTQPERDEAAAQPPAKRRKGLIAALASLVLTPASSSR